MTNEANDRPSSVVSNPLLEDGPSREDVTIEATAVRENLTNEPTGSSSLIAINPLLEEGFAESRVAGAGTNEATVGRLSVAGCPLLGDRCEPLQDVTNEAIPDPLSIVSGPLSGMRCEHSENATNETLTHPLISQVPAYGLVKTVEPARPSPWSRQTAD